MKGGWTIVMGEMQAGEVTEGWERLPWAVFACEHPLFFLQAAACFSLEHVTSLLSVTLLL